MCGIGGVLNFDGRSPEEGELERMASRLAHRGPDGKGVFCSGPVGFVHRRLAIMDPRGGIQPMANEDGRVVVVFNGEIYNFRELSCELMSKGHHLTSTCDTEVIVHAYEEWGCECVRRLHGMFAFAVLDLRDRTIFLARDRLGIKPLCYFHTKERFGFSSSLPALGALTNAPHRMNPAAVGHFFQDACIPAPLTIFQEIHKVPPAHHLRVHFDGNSSGPHRYWAPSFQPDPLPSEADWLDQTEEALRRSVRTHLMSDVSFGAFLSGGVDSSTVVALMAQEMARPVQTFTIGFENPSFDERPFARQIAERLGTDHYEEVIQPDALGVLPEIIRNHGEPFGDSSAIPTHCLARMASRHVKMVLGGDGGDELFAGYPWYANVTRTFSGPMGRMRGNLGFFLGDKSDPIKTWRDAQAVFSRAELKQLLKPEFLPPDWNRQAPGPDLCSQMQMYDLANYLPNDLLPKLDVATMASSLEARVPLLDHLFVEFCGRIPSAFKLAQTPTGLEPKALLKKLASRLIGPGFFDRQKQGFSVPLRDWLAPGSRPKISERLHLAESSPFFLPGAVAKIAEDLENPGQKLWLIMVFAEWLDQNPHSLP